MIKRLFLNILTEPGNKAKYVSWRGFAVAIIGLFMGIVVYRSLANVSVVLADGLVPLFVGVGVALLVDSLAVGAICAFLSSVVAPFLGAPFFSAILNTLPLRPENPLYEAWSGSLSAPASNFAYAALSGAIAAVGFAAFRWAKMKTKKGASVLAIALVVMSFLVNGFLLAGSIARPANLEPKPYVYRFDGWKWLKTFYLMKKGFNYYKSAWLADKFDRRKLVFSQPLNYRLPTIFWLWRILPTGAAIVYLFLFMSAIALLCFFLVGRRYAGDLAGYAAAVSLFPYLIWGAATPYFSFAEHWGLFFVAIAFLLLAYQRNILAVPFFLIGAAIREQFALFLLLGIFTSLLRRQLKESAVWAAALGLMAVLVRYHGLMAKRYIPPVRSATVSVRFFQEYVAPKLGNLLRRNSFGIEPLVVPRFSLVYVFSLADIALLIFIVLAAVGLLWRRPSALSSLVTPYLIILVFLSVILEPSRTYWAVLYMPFVFLAWPWTLSKLAGILQGNQALAVSSRSREGA